MKLLSRKITPVLVPLLGVGFVSLLKNKMDILLVTLSDLN